MPIITSADLKTHIYADVLDEITRNDDTIVSSAIATAEKETKMYLSRYDLLPLFGDSDTAPTILDEYLKSLVKDIACWHLIRLANLNIGYETFRVAYQDALAALKSIMQGGANPEDWPYKDTSTETVPDGDSICWSSNPKRHSHF